MTRKLTGTVRIWDRPPTYIYDTPGVMVPFFGTGEEAIEKGIKLALTCMSRPFIPVYCKRRSED